MDPSNGSSELYLNWTRKAHQEIQKLFELPPEDTVAIMYPLTLVIPVTIIYGIIFVTAVVGNVSTCIVIAKNKCMHTATNYYLFSLAISDMLLLISGLPPEMYRIWSPDTYVFGEAFCILQGFAAETSANATVLTITAFTIERYLAICHPFLTHTMSKLSRVIKYIVAIWIVALCLAVPQAIQFGIEYEFIDGKQNSHCTVVTTVFEHAFEISTFVFFVGPMTLITVLYVFIGIQLRKSKNIAGGQRSSVSSSNEAGRMKQLKNASSQNRVVKMLVAVVAAFFICWAPFHAQRLLAVYLSNSSQENQEALIKIYTILMYASGVLYFLSTTINPVLYHIMSNKFRKAFKKTFSKTCRRRKRNLDNKTYCMITRPSPHLSNLPLSASEGMVQNRTKPSNLPQPFPHKPSFHSFQETPTKARPHRDSSKEYSQSTTSMMSVSNTSESESSNKAYQTPNNSKLENKKRPNETDNHFRNFTNKMMNLFQKPRHNYQSNTYETDPNISNSSLQNMDDKEFSSADLVRYMKEVNEDIN